jgi:hypothetical protein
MAYCIFWKSLRSLEEFRKNSLVQIPSKSPCRKSQSLAEIQIQLKFENQIPIWFLPGSDQTGPVCRDGPPFPRRLPRLSPGLVSPSTLSVFFGIHFLCWVSSFANPPSLFPALGTRALHVRFITSAALPDPSRAAASPRHSRPCLPPRSAPRDGALALNDLNPLLKTPINISCHQWS